MEGAGSGHGRQRGRRTRRTAGTVDGSGEFPPTPTCGCWPSPPSSTPLGNGALTTTFALYFTHVVGLRATQVGAGPVGRRAGRPARAGTDGPPRRHPRTARAAAAADDRRRASPHWVCCSPTTSGCWCSCSASRRSSTGAAAPSATAWSPAWPRAAGRCAFKAYLRAVTNVGISLGALLGGLALWVDRPWAYLGVFALNARHLRARRGGSRSPAAHRAGAGPAGGPAAPAGAARPAVRRRERADRHLRHPLPRDRAGGAAVAGDPHVARRSGSWPSSC